MARAKKVKLHITLQESIWGIVEKKGKKKEFSI